MTISHLRDHQQMTGLCHPEVQGGGSTHVTRPKRESYLSRKVTLWPQAAIEGYSGALKFYSSLFCSPGPLERATQGVWPTRRVRHALLVFWAAFSQLLLRCLRGRLRILFQKVVRKRVWAVWGNSYLTGLHLELLKKTRLAVSLLWPKNIRHPTRSPSVAGMIGFLHVWDSIEEQGLCAEVPTEGGPHCDGRGMQCPRHYTLELLPKYWGGDGGAAVGRAHAGWIITHVCVVEMRTGWGWGWGGGCCRPGVGKSFFISWAVLRILNANLVFDVVTKVYLSKDAERIYII